MSAKILWGFEGSRHLSTTWMSTVAEVISARPRGTGIATGCARGLDALARAATPPDDLTVFSVRSGVWGKGRGAYAARSSALVRTVAASGPTAQMTSWVISPCPSGIAPARSWRSGSTPSGSWSAAALAAGHGLPLFVFWCTPSAAELPDWPAGRWMPVTSGPFANAFHWSPAAVPFPGFSV